MYSRLRLKLFHTNKRIVADTDQQKYQNMIQYTHFSVYIIPIYK